MKSYVKFTKLRQVIFWRNKGRFIRAALPLFEGDRIRINPIWIDYLIVHRNILKGFTIYKLNCFLARKESELYASNGNDGKSAVFFLF